MFELVYCSKFTLKYLPSLPSNPDCSLAWTSPKGHGQINVHLDFKTVSCFVFKMIFTRNGELLKTKFFPSIKEHIPPDISCRNPTISLVCLSEISQL